MFRTNLSQSAEVLAVILYMASTLSLFASERGKYRLPDRILLPAFLVSATVAIFLPLPLKAKLYVAALIFSAGLVRLLVLLKKRRGIQPRHRTD